MKEGSPVSTWPDILIGDNRFPDDAWQFDERLCPTWVRDGDGRPAVRFDGWSTYLATSPMETGDQQTAFVVFAPSPASFASSSHGGMLLKYGLNAPTLELTMLHRPYAPRAGLGGRRCWKCRRMLVSSRARRSSPWRRVRWPIRTTPIGNRPSCWSTA